MAVMTNADGFFISYRDDGSLACWGIAEMFIPDGGAHVRQVLLRLPKFAQTPSVTTTIFSDESSGQMFSVSNLTFNDDDPDATICKVSASNVEIAVDSDFEYLCHFHVIGMPATHQGCVA